MMKIAIALLLVNIPFSSFEYHETNPSSLFPYYNAVSDDQPLGHLSNPAYLPLWKTMYLNVDYAKPYWMEEINSGNLRAGYGFNNLAIQASWNRFGIDEYREDTLTGSFALMPCKYFSTGIGVSYYYIYINTEDLSFTYGLTDFTLSALILPFDWLNISYTHKNIYTAFHNEREDLLYPGMSFGISIKPVPGISFIWNINRLYYDYLNSFSISTNLLSCLCLKAGYSKETSSYAASFVFQYKKLSVSYGLNHHPYLGLTHKLGLTISTSDIAFEQINYNTKLFKSTLPESQKKIHINSCTLDELIESQLFPKNIAERIIKYRKIMGPVNKKALLQIGLSQKDFKKIKKYIIGFAPEPNPVKYKKFKKYSKHRKSNKGNHGINIRKKLFQKLLERGLSASISLRVADLAKDKNKKKIILEIKRLPDITDEKKKLIIKICNDTL